MSKLSQAKKPCCKVCQDAGKPEEVYTSHWVKDLTGKTVCPTLLNTECRFCHKIGHTTKYCKELEKMNKEKERAEKKLQYKKQPVEKPSQKKVVTTNQYAVFCESSDDEEEVEECSAKCEDQEKKPIQNTWASIASKPKEQKPIQLPVQKTGLVLLSDFIKPLEVKQESKLAPWANTNAPKKSWADLSDSEDEYDDEDDALPEVNFQDDTW